MEILGAAEPFTNGGGRLVDINVVRKEGLRVMSGDSVEGVDGILKVDVEFLNGAAVTEPHISKLPTNANATEDDLPGGVT